MVRRNTPPKKYNLGLNPGPRIKCGIAIRLKYALDKPVTALLANTTSSSLDKYLKKIELHLKVGITLEYNPDFTQNPRLYFFLLYLKTILIDKIKKNIKYD